MVRDFWNIGLILLVTASASAAPPLASGPPTQQLIRVDSSGEMRVYYQVTYCTPEARTRTVQIKRPVTKEVQYNVNGETRTKTVTEYVTEQVEQSYTITVPRNETKVRTAKLDKLKAFETDGKLIPLKTLKERVKEDTLVLVSADHQMIGDYYAALFKPGTIILAFEQETQPAPQAAPLPPAENNAPPPPTSGLFPPIRTVSHLNDDDALLIRVPESTPVPTFPPSMPPVFVFASREGADQFKLRQLRENSFEVTGYKVKRQGTGKQMVPVKLTQTVRHHEITAIADKDLQFFAGNGSALAADRVKEKLSREATVLYSADGEAIDAFWLQNLKATTLVVVGPQLPGGCGTPMMGYGVPCAPAAAPASPPATETPPQPPAAPPAPSPPSS